MAYQAGMSLLWGGFLAFVLVVAVPGVGGWVVVLGLTWAVLQVPAKRALRRDTRCGRLGVSARTRRAAGRSQHHGQA